MSVKFEITSEYLEKLRVAIRLHNKNYIQKQLQDLFPADIAEILNHIGSEEAKFIHSILPENIAADVLVEMQDEAREKLLHSLTSKEIADHINDNMDSDDAADMIADLPDHKQGEVLAHMEDAEQASDIVDLLNYDENTAGGLMAKELIRVHVNKNVLECVREIRRQAEEVEHIYNIYVVDDDEKLLGLLSLKKLITSSLRSEIKNIYNSDIISVKTNVEGEEVARIMEKYNLVAIPVVDATGRLMGRITIDDIVDVIRKEETEDVQKMAGMEALDEPYMNSSMFEMVKKRVGWLVILFIGESLTATAMSFFEDEIAKAVVLALFVPLIISSGGNTGSQASTLIIRAMSLGEFRIRDWFKIFKKELKVGLILGFLLGILGFLRIAVWSTFVDIYGPHWFMIGLTVGVSLTGVVVWGNLMGSLFPILLKKMKFDPAVASAPFVATMVDVTGLILYFSIASILLKGLLL